MQILADLEVGPLRLLTNNPAKRASLEGYGLTVMERVPLRTQPTAENVRCLAAKQRRLGHLSSSSLTAGRSPSARAEPAIDAPGRVSTTTTPLRFEILPFASGEREASEAHAGGDLLARHGVDHSLDVVCPLEAAGHAVVLHVAARMVRDRRHLDELLARMAGAGITDVFLVSGDALRPAGPYTSAFGPLRRVAQARSRRAPAGRSRTLG